jgi:hypothetical protein
VRDEHAQHGRRRVKVGVARDEQGGHFQRFELRPRDRSRGRERKPTVVR